MKRVLIVITTSMVSYGGLTSVVMNYYRAMDLSNFQIDFASTNTLSEELVKELKENNSVYHKLPNRKNVVRYIGALYKLTKSYEVVHVHANSATAVLELLPSKIAGVQNRITQIHTSKCDHWILHKLLFPMFKHSYTKGIAVSNKAGEWIFKDGFLILRNGIDSEKYKYSSSSRALIRSLHGIDDTTVLFGHVGKIYKPKNHHFLVDVFNEYVKLNPHSKLLLVGDGVLRNEIQNKIDDLGLKNNVIFAGMQRDIASYLSAMDVFVFPSLWEGMPLSLIEAQASGIICFASNTIDKESNITGKVNTLALEIGPKEWALKIHDADVSNRENQSLDNIERIERKNFDIKYNAKILDEIYLQI